MYFVCIACEYGEGVRGCEGDDNAGVGDGGGVVVVSAGYECVGCTRDAGIVSSAVDVLGMSVVCGRNGVGGGCEMGMCLGRGGVGSEGESG